MRDLQRTRSCGWSRNLRWEKRLRDESRGPSSLKMFVFFKGIVHCPSQSSLITSLYNQSISIFLFGLGELFI